MDSSPPIPSRPNAKPRNSETGDPMRRSFRSSPFPGKTQTGRVESGDKENQISDVVVKAPKIAKNFMSPTISAVSKINHPSPRKKILSEKNELSRSFDKTHHHNPQVRSSVSFSDVVSFIGEEDKDKDEIFIGEKKKLDEDDVTVTDMDDFSPLPASVVPFTFPVFEANEVDASVTPYDPKKNYLSPRPQFLHYRPNPRVECKELFSSESSSTDTDLSGEESQQEEEVASKESVEEVVVESQQVVEVASQESVEEVAEESKQVEEVASEEGVVAVEEEEAEVTLDESDEEVVVGESTEETHQVPKQSRFKMSKLLGWIMVLGVAYTLLVSSVTFTHPNINEGSHFYKFQIPPEITKSARESFEQMSEKLGMWAGSSLVYMDKLISSLREEEGYGTFQFHNLTGVLEETRLSDAVFQPTSGQISVAESLVDSLDWSSEMDTEEENVVHEEPEELESSGETDLEVVHEEDVNGFEQESEGGEINSEFDEQAEITVATYTEVNVGDVYSEAQEEESGGQETDGLEEQREYEESDQKNVEESHQYETGSAQNDEKMMEESESNSHHVDAEESAAISGHQQEEASSLANAESVPEGGIEETAETNLAIEAEPSEVDGNDLEEESGIGEEVVTRAEDWKELLINNQKKVMVLVSTVMVMLAAAAAFLLANKKAKPVMQEEGERTTTISDAKEVNVEQAPVENLIKERLSSLNFQEEKEVNDDRKREEVSSFPSEMSFSFHKDKSLRSCSNRDELKEYQSGGGGGKKSNDSGESMASSASEYSIGGSVSYGSFTTYEKIQKKSGRKEEEMVTPVRRSSRIRNHQHSGQ